MLQDAMLSSSPESKTASRPPQDITQLVIEFEQRITNILCGVVDKVDGLQRHLEGAALALTGEVDRETAASAVSGSPTPILPIAEISAQVEREIDARFGDGSPQSQHPAETNLPAQAQPIHTAAAVIEPGETVALHTAADTVSVPAASDELPLGPHTQAIENRRLQSAQAYDSIPL